MARYEFSVIKYVPNIIRFEPVNMGVALMDKVDMRIRNRFITDFDQLFTRLGTDRINGLEKSFEKYVTEAHVTEASHLWNLHKSSNGSMFYSQPTTITPPGKGYDPGRILDFVFAKMISVHGVKKKTRKRPRSAIMGKIKNYCKSKMPSEAVKESFREPTKFGYDAVRDFVFVKDKRPRFAIDVFDSPATLDTRFRLFLHEIDSMNHEYRIRSFLFTSEDTGRQSGKKHAELMKRLNLSIVGPEHQDEAMDVIRSEVC